MITTLEYVSLWDVPPNVPGAVNYGYFADAIGDVRWTERLDNNEECVLTVPSTSRGAAARAQMILGLHFAPVTPGGIGDIRVFRLTSVTEDAGTDGITVTLQGRSLAFDLTNAGRMRDVLSGGRQEYTLAGTLSGGTWLTTYALPQLQRAGYAFFTAPSWGGVLVPLALENATPGQLVQDLADFLGLEWTLEPLGTQWVIASYGAVNGTLSPLRIRDGVSLRRLERRRDSIGQATIIEPVGRAGHSTLSQSIQHHAAQGSNFDVPSNTLELQAMVSDIGYVYKPVQMSHQWIGYYLQRQSTGRCFAIVDSVVGAAQVVTVDSLTTLGFAPDDSVFEFRASRDASPTLFVPTPGVPLRITSASGLNPVTVDNPFTGADPVPTDGVHVDHRAANSYTVLATTCSNIANVAGSTTDQDLTLASTAGLILGTGMWGFLHTSASTPWGLYGRPFTIVQIISSTVVRVRMRYPFEAGRPLTVAAGTRQARFYQPRLDPVHVNVESAATNQLTLENAANYSNGDLIEYHLDSGALVGGLPAPSSMPIAAGGYGVVSKTAEFSGQRCLRNLLWAGNPWFDDWAGGAGSAPDGWTVEHPFGGTGVPTKVTSSLPGPGTVNAVGLTGATLGSVASPVFYARPTAGDSQISFRVRLRTGTGAGWTSSGTARVYIDLLPNGSTTIIGQAVIAAPNYPSPPANYQLVDADTVVDVDLLATDILHTPGVGAKWAPWDGIKIRITAFGTGSDCTIGGVFVIQDSLLPPSPDMVKTTDHALVGLSQLRLDALDQPIETIDADAVDLSRLLVEQFGTASLVKGRPIEIVYEPLGLVISNRIAALEFRAAVGGETRVSVQTRTRDLADILADQLSA